MDNKNNKKTKQNPNSNPPHNSSVEQITQSREQTLPDGGAKKNLGTIPKKIEDVLPHPSHSGKDKNTPLSTTKKQLPRLGEPGGLDDPLRRGMNGTDVKWYLRFLEKGLTPVEAKLKTLERKISPSATDAGAKRPRQSPGEKPPTKKVKQSYAEVAKTTKVAVLPKLYPDAKLTNEQLNAIEETIVEAMTEEVQQGVNFEGLVYRPNMLVFGSVDSDTTSWLTKVIDKLDTWEGIPLTVKVGDDIPKPHVINVFLPKSIGRETEKLVKLLKVNNTNICTDDWKVLAKKEQGKGTLLTIGINAVALKQIINQGNTLRYRFTRVRVYGHKKGLATEEKAAATQEEETSSKVEEDESEVQDLPELDLTLLHLDSEPGQSPEHSDDE